MAIPDPASQLTAQQRNRVKILSDQMIAGGNTSIPQETLDAELPIIVQMATMRYQAHFEDDDDTKLTNGQQRAALENALAEEELRLRRLNRRKYFPPPPVVEGEPAAVAEVQLAELLEQADQLPELDEIADTP